jgi:hypothetical protein
MVAAAVKPGKREEARPALDPIVRDVLKRLGFPKGVVKVLVKPIGPRSYRVNVYGEGVGGESGLVVSPRIIHSEFVTV